MSLVDRMPPFNVEAEARVNGALLLGSEEADDVFARLEPGDFWVSDQADLFRVLKDLRAAGKPLDSTLAIEAAQGRVTYELVTETLARAPSAANVTYMADIVRQLAVRRAVIAVAAQMTAEAYGTELAADDLLGRAEARVLAIDDRRSSDAVRGIADLAGLALERLDARKAGTISGLPTGLPDFDAMTDGFAPGQVIILAARPSMGKTALALNIAEYAALDLGEPVFFASLEMGGIEIGERTLASRGKVAGSKLRGGQIGFEDAARVAEAYREMRLRGPLHVDDMPGRSAGEVAAIARRLKRREGLALVVIDYLQLLRPDAEAASREQEIAAISRRLKLMARELNVPVLALSQLNRKAEGREDRRPMMSDLRESGAIEQDADVVLLLHRPDYYKPDDKPGQAELIVAKNRNGPVSTINLTFRKELMRFESYCREFGPPPGTDGAF